MGSPSLVQQPATELLQHLTSGEVTSAELTRAWLDEIEAKDAHVGAYLHVDAEAALARARTIDQKRQAGESLGKLAGLPVAVTMAGGYAPNIDDTVDIHFQTVLIAAEFQNK